MSPPPNLTVLELYTKFYSCTIPRLASMTTVSQFDPIGVFHQIRADIGIPRIGLLVRRSCRSLDV